VVVLDLSYNELCGEIPPAGRWGGSRRWPTGTTSACAVRRCRRARAATEPIEPVLVHCAATLVHAWCSSARNNLRASIGHSGIGRPFSRFGSNPAFRQFWVPSLIAMLSQCLLFPSCQFVFATFSLLKVKTRGIPAIFLKGNTANYRDRCA
jgi:hypothetical protein